MNRDRIMRIIEKAVVACVNKNPRVFASLFADTGKIILKKDREILKPEIENITTNYFANLADIKIDVHRICIEENHAFIEWSWENVNILTQEKNCHDNAIALTFENDLISVWREYKG